MYIILINKSDNFETKKWHIPAKIMFIVQNGELLLGANRNCVILYLLNNL